MKLSNLLKQDLKIVEKKKIFFLVPAILVLVAIIVGILQATVFSGDFINVSMDFQGGYTMNIKLSTKLTEDTFDSYAEQVEEIAQNLKDDNGNVYGLKISDIRMQGSGETASLYVKYKSLKTSKDVDERAFMEDEVNVKFRDALQQLFVIAPSSVSYDSGKYTVKFLQPISNPIFLLIQSNLTNSELSLSAGDININSDSNTITIATNIIGKDSTIKELATINDIYSGQATLGDLVSATISSELLTNAILAVALALTLMLAYIAFRFETSSGLATIVGLMHDLIIMLSFVIIFHIEIGGTFIAALITVLGYSINNSIILFDRVREYVKKQKDDKRINYADIANKSVSDTLVRSINTTLTTLFMICMVAIIGVSSIRTFALPIIVGLIAGTYSTIFIAPTIWSASCSFIDKKFIRASKRKHKKAVKATVKK